MSWVTASAAGLGMLIGGVQGYKQMRAQQKRNDQIISYYNKAEKSIKDMVNDVKQYGRGVGSSLLTKIGYSNNPNKTSAIQGMYGNQLNSMHNVMTQGEQQIASLEANKPARINSNDLWAATIKGALEGATGGYTLGNQVQTGMYYNDKIAELQKQLDTAKGTANTGFLDSLMSYFT